MERKVSPSAMFLRGRLTCTSRRRSLPLVSLSETVSKRQSWEPGHWVKDLKLPAMFYQNQHSAELMSEKQLHSDPTSHFLATPICYHLSITPYCKAARNCYDSRLHQNLSCVK